MLPLHHLNSAMPALPALIPMTRAPLLLGLSRSAIYRAAGEGKIIVKKLGRSAMVDSASALAFIKSLPVASIRPDSSAKTAA